MEIRPRLDSDSGVPLYRQLSGHLQNLIESGRLNSGDRLPPTRELAVQLGLNRTTVSAAYDLLEEAGLIKGSVGRGSFVSGSKPQAPALDWSSALTSTLSTFARTIRRAAIDFSASRPSEALFPVDEFRRNCEEVLAEPNLRSLLQLGSPAGLEPLRQYILRRSGVARDTDDIVITNGCQQAIDLLRRALVRPGMKVAIEEPVYPGLSNLFLESGAELIGITVTASGADPNSVRRAVEAGARVIVLTPSFQNPTGATIPAANRAAIVEIARAAGVIIIENDIYSELAYRDAAYPSNAAPRLKSLDPNVIFLGSFSKIAFPGLRCGWIIAPRPAIARLTELKQLADLHTDQLSQAFLLRFAESGRLDAHQQRMIEAGRERLRAVTHACREFLPGCRFTPPAGGMNLWLELPDGLDASALRGLAQQAGVDYLPGGYFSISRRFDNALRLSFAGVDPREIRRGIEILGGLISQFQSFRENFDAAPATAPALV